jgi:hypothetical protein
MLGFGMAHAEDAKQREQQVHITKIIFNSGIIMKTIRVILLATALIVLSGCAAPSFVKPAPDKLSLGKSTREDIIQSVGNPPPAQSDATVNSEKVQLLNYAHGENPKFWGFIIEHRNLTYTVFDNIMVGEEYNSTYDNESTEFDTDKIPSIEKGKSTRADVIALLGKPSGEVLYPLVADKKGRGLVYAYSWARFAGILTSTNSKLLIVSLNDNNVVSNVSFKKDGTEQIKQ